MELHETYFYTATILNWNHLLRHDKYKMIIIDSWKYLVDKNLVTIYAYVIMPNHIHIIWRLINSEAKELPHTAFHKFTGHQFLKMMRSNGEDLTAFTINSSTRKHQFWERESLPIPLYTDKVMLQKLDYLHDNPIQPKWRLCKYPEEYEYSSAAYYLGAEDKFGILTHYRE